LGRTGIKEALRAPFIEGPRAALTRRGGQRHPAPEGTRVRDAAYVGQPQQGGGHVRRQPGGTVWAPPSDCFLCSTLPALKRNSTQPRRRYAVLGFNIGCGWTTTPALDCSPAARRDPHEPQRANRGCGRSEPRRDEVHANSVCRGVKQRQQQRQIVGGHPALTRSWSDW
jgi:hypothetical protein